MGIRYILSLFLLITIWNVLVSSKCFRSQRTDRMIKMTPILENNDYHDYKRVVHINLECKYIFGVQKPFELFCCDDLQEKLGICKECYPGFKSRRKKYEYRCMNWRCICKDNQRCHNEHGCIDVKPLYTEVDSKHDGFTPLTLTNEQSAPTPVAATTSLTNASLGMVKTEIFIYSLFGVGTFFILCFIIGLCVYKKSHKENINSNSETIQNTGVINRIYEESNNVEQNQLVARERASDNEYVAM